MTVRAIAITVGLLVAPAAALAQSAPVDPRWAPYLGCWQLQREATGTAAADLEAVASRRARAPEAREDVMICVTPSSEPNAVAQQTVLNGESVLDEVVAADGTRRSGEHASCTSTRQAEWSTSGRQLFTRGTVACEGQPERALTGVSFVMPGPTWVDVQMVEVKGNRSVRVRRYGLTREASRVARASVVGAPARWSGGRWTRSRKRPNAPPPRCCRRR